MQFGLVSALLLAAISPALAATPLVQQIQQLTQATSDVNDIFKKLNPRDVVQQTTRGIETWQSTIVVPKQNYIQSFPQSVANDDQAVVCQEYVNFATKSQDLMNIMIAKNGLLSQTPYTTPVRTLLDSDTAMTKTLSTNIEGVVPECKEAIAEPWKKLQEASDAAVKAYKFEDEE